MSSEARRSTLLDTWTDTSIQLFESMAAANRAALAAFGVDTDVSAQEEPAERIEPAEDLAEWDTATTVDSPEEVTVGESFEFSKTISEDDVREFAAASGDTNPLHLDDEYAEETRFQERIAHGTLVGGLISAALARIPGLVIYLSQDLEFHNPVSIGETLTATCEIVEELGNNQYRLTTQVRNAADEVVIDGEAVVLIDQNPDA